MKQLFGVLFLGVAIYLLQPLLPDALSMLLWSALAILPASGSFRSRRAPVSQRRRRCAVGLIALVYGVLLLIGVASGGRDPLQPLDSLAAPRVRAVHKRTQLTFQRIKTVADLEAAVASASAAGRPVMLDFYADWCVSCKEMEKYTFTDAGVQAALANAVLLQADVTANDADDQALLERFEIFGPPTIAFFGADGVERKNFRLVGFAPADRFREQSFRRFRQQLDMKSRLYLPSPSRRAGRGFCIYHFAVAPRLAASEDARLSRCILPSQRNQRR